jgi:hypothetical protein
MSQQTRTLGHWAALTALACAASVLLVLHADSRWMLSAIVYGIAAGILGGCALVSLGHDVEEAAA